MRAALSGGSNRTLLFGRKMRVRETKSPAAHSVLFALIRIHPVVLSLLIVQYLLQSSFFHTPTKRVTITQA